MDSEDANKAAAAGRTLTVATIGGVATTMSAAEMTAALATVGFGSMRVGIAVTAAVPLAIGGICYGLRNYFSDY